MKLSRGLIAHTGLGDLQGVTDGAVSAWLGEQGLFRGATMQSGALSPIRDRETSLKVARQLHRHAQRARNRSLADCAVDALLAAQAQVHKLVPQHLARLGRRRARRGHD